MDNSLNISLHASGILSTLVPVPVPVSLKNHKILFFLNNLDNIAKITEGCKIYIDVNNLICVDTPYLFQGLWRYYSNISRKDALFVLTKLLNDIEFYINSIYIENIDNVDNNKTKNNNKFIKLHKINKNIHYDEYNEITNIISKLTLSINGIQHLYNTYKSDIQTSETLQTIIKKAQALIISFTNMV